MGLPTIKLPYAINLEHNLYYHGKIKDIKVGIGTSGNKWAIIKLEGKYGERSVYDESSITTHNQILDVYAISGLANYVESELDVDDPIFVVGYLKYRKVRANGVYFHKLTCQAEYIYKEDCLKFYI